MKKSLILGSFLVLTIFSIRAQELAWEKMHKESEGGWADDIAVVNGKVWLSCSGQLFVSTDNGLSWNYVVTAPRQSIPSKGVPNYTWGTDRKILVSGDSILFGNKISVDNGATWDTWTMNGSTLPNWYFEPTVMHFHGKKLYLGALYNGFFQSADLGTTFSYMTSGIPNQYGYYEPARTIEFYNHQPVIATHTGLYRWNGGSWIHPSCHGLPTTVVNTTTAKLVDRIRFLNSRWIVSSNFGVYYSDDQGSNWQQYDAIPPITGMGTWDMYTTPPVFYNLDVSNGKIMVSFDTQVYISSDGGVTWTYSEMTDRVMVTRIVSVGSSFLAATSGGVYRSTDGGNTWLKSNKGFERQYFTGISVKNGEGFFSTSGAGIFKSTQKGKVLTPFNNGIDQVRYVRINSVSPDKVISTRVKYYSYAGSSARWDYKVYLSGNDQAQWNPLDSFPVQTPSIVQASANGTIAARGANPLPGGANDLHGIFLSEDGGQNWKKVFTNVTNNGTKYEDFVSSMLFENDTMYVGAMYSGIFKSWDNGQTWTAINNGLHLANPSDSAWWTYDTTALVEIATIKAYKNNLYAVGENYLYYGYGALHHSTDGGKNWVKKDFSSLGPAFQNLIVSGLTIAENGALYTRLYTKDYVKSYLVVSYDNANTWEFFGEDFPDGYIYALDVVGDYVYASGKTGLWRLNNPDSIQEEEEVITKLPEEDLRTNISIYPNPFTNEVTLAVHAARNPNLSVEIFTADGRRVIKTKSLQSYDNKFVWNGRDDGGTMLKSGLYLVRVIDGNRIITRKIVKN